MMSGLAVTAAEPSGILGVLKESFAASKAPIEGRSGPNELVKAIEAEFETSEGAHLCQGRFSREDGRCQSR